MLQVNNETPFQATLALLPDRAGIDTLFTVVKATFAIGERWGIAPEQLPVTLADEYYGDPAVTSIRLPSDVCLGKPGTDILLAGSAWAPGGRPAWQMDVSIAVGSISKTVRVFGDRVWDSGPAGAVPVLVAPFEKMPLVWERAFGGSDHTGKSPRAERRNPVGRGFRAPDSAKPLTGLPLPNLEDPAAPISSWKDRPLPCCFAPIAPSWEPRIAYAGTYDDSWQQSRAPYLPDDFDLRFFQLAPPGLVVPGFLKGGELVEVRGATPSGMLRFQLPTVPLSVSYVVADEPETRLPVLDTVVIEPDAGRLVMVWRSAYTCDKKALKVTEVEATLLQAA